MELTNIHNFVWYGNCSDGECIPYSLNSDSVIDKVYQINNGNAIRVWSCDIVLDQSFDTLECGYAYYIKLKSNDGITPKSTIEIPGATTSYFSENNNNRDAYISDCVIPCCIKTNNGSLVNSESYNLLFNTNILPDYITGIAPEQNIDIYDNPIIAIHYKPSFYESVNENKTIVNPNWTNDPTNYWGKAYIIRDKKPENYNGTIYDWLKSKEIEYKNYPKTNYSWYIDGTSILEPKKAYNGTIGAISIFFKGASGYLLNVTGTVGLGWFRKDLISMSDGASGGWCVQQEYYETGRNFINTWQHLGVIWNDFLNIYEFYINGIKLPTEIYGLNTIQEKILSNRIAIGGRYTTQQNFKGYISDVAIYAEPITEQRLLELYNNGIKSGDASDAELWYRCGNDDDEILEFGSNMENPFTSKNSGTLGTEYDAEYAHGSNVFYERRTNLQGPDVFHPTNSIIDSEQASIDQQGTYCEITPTPITQCVTITSANNKGYSSDDPVKHEAGGTYYWCMGTQYTDSGVQNVIDCFENELTVENGGVEIQFWNKNKTMQITDLTEIEKLGLATSNLGPDNYTFSVRYKAISQNGQESISGGRTIKVVQSGTVEDASKEPCPKELWDTNEINKIVHFDFSNSESYTSSGNSITSLIDLTDNFSMTKGDGGGTLQTSSNQLNAKNTAHFNGSESYVSSNESQFADANGNHYAIGVYKITSVNDTKDSLWSFESNDSEAKREYAISAGNSTTWEGEIDLDSLSSKRISNVPKIDWKTNSQIGTTNYNNNWHIYAVVFNKTTNQIYMRIDGHIASDIHPYSNKMSNTVDMRFVRNRTSKVLGCYVAEFFGVASNSDIIINDSTEIEKAEGYLAHKWEIQNLLPTNHPFKNDMPVK